MADKTLSILAHILGIFTEFIGPLVIYLVATDAHTKVHARNALNFQLSLLIYFTVSTILVVIFVGIFLLGALIMFNVIACIVAAVKASNGQTYKYPLAIQFLK